MPAQRPRASFDPLSPELDVKQLVEETEHFQYVDRITCDMIDQQGLANFNRLVLAHVVIGGKPLVIDGYQKRLDPWTFSSKWLQDNHGEKPESARDLTKKSTLPLSMGHYLKNMGRLAEQYFENPDNYKDVKDRQRIYLKDIDCPNVWFEKLKEKLPPNVCYLNDSIGELGGAGAVDENAPTGGKRKGRGAASAGDLMSSLPASMRAENLMCYIGHEGTYTPAHREMCASLGQNIMVEASDVIGQDGKPERPGSSIWFMTESKDRQTVQEYWLSILGHDIEVENHFAQIAAWKQAPFSVYVVEQRAGDFILIPPLAPHQVWNRGTRTMKVAWNRTTVETLEMALHEALPGARMVCRDEQYKNKAIVYFTLQKYSSLLARVRDQEQTAANPTEASVIRNSPRIRQLQKDFKRLFILYQEILLSEMFSPETPHEKNVQHVNFEGYVTCAYCRGNIFNRFLTCPSCEYALGTETPEAYDICMECYAMGRSCGCISKLRWVEQFKWKELTQKYEQWRRQYLDLELNNAKRELPLPLADERRKLVKKTLAQICQEQLKRRPWKDINKTEPDEDEEDDSGDENIVYNADGSIGQKKKKRSETWLKNHRACHICCHRHEIWRMVGCKCGRFWCYGSLYRGFDTMPQTIMEDPNWTCPHCRGICFAGNCRKDPRQKPYEPKGTILGHDTKKIADARSVESLVDFGVSNLNYLRESVEGPSNLRRLTRRQEEAEKDKQTNQELNDRIFEIGGDGINEIDYDNDVTGIDPRLDASTAIDPELGGGTSQVVQQQDEPVASLLRSGTEDEGLSGHYEGYQPASQQGFVVPTAVMFSQPSLDDEAASEATPYPGIPVDGTNGASKKRDLQDKIKRQPLAKRRRLDGEPPSEATKQFRREQEKRAKDEARKSGRFIMYMGAIRGLSRVMKFRIGKEAAMQVEAEEAMGHMKSGSNAANAAAETAPANVLLQSDLAPPPTDGADGNKIAKPVKHPNNVRVRVERDDDFRTRRRGPSEKRATDKRTKGTQRGAYEDLEIISDPEDEVDDEDGEPAGAGAIETTSAGSRRRRISAWQAKRHENDDEDEGMEALPDDWKDGRRTNNTKSTKPKPKVTGKQPSSAQSRPSNAVADGDSESQVSDADGSDDADADASNKQHSGSVVRSQEADRLAKMDAAGLLEESSEDDSGRESPMFVRETNSSNARSLPSLSSRGGRKVKIVSSRRNLGRAHKVSGKPNGSSSKTTAELWEESDSSDGIIAAR